MEKHILPICGNLELVELSKDEDALREFLLPFISEHRRDYYTILALGDIASIEFVPGEVWLQSTYSTIGSMKFYSIKRFTRRKLESIAWWFSSVLCEGMHEKPYCPEIEKAFDYDC